MNHKLNLDFDDRQSWFGKFKLEHGTTTSNTYLEMVKHEFPDARSGWDDRNANEYTIFFISEECRLRFIMKYL